MIEQPKKGVDGSVIVGTVLMIVGVCLLVFANGQGSPDVAVTMFVVGLGFAAMGGVVFVKGAEIGKDFQHHKATVKEFAKDKHGIVWVWVVALLTWAIMAIAYFALSTVVYLVLDSVEAFYPWGGEELGLIGFIRNVMGWFLIIMTVGIIGWALINSGRRVEDTFPY